MNIHITETHVRVTKASIDWPELKALIAAAVAPGENPNRTIEVQLKERTRDVGYGTGEFVAYVAITDDLSPSLLEVAQERTVE